MSEILRVDAAHREAEAPPVVKLRIVVNFKSGKINVTGPVFNELLVDLMVKRARGLALIRNVGGEGPDHVLEIRYFQQTGVFEADFHSPEPHVALDKEAICDWMMKKAAEQVVANIQRQAARSVGVRDESIEAAPAAWLESLGKGRNGG